MGVERAKAPNLVLRRIREVERRETREEFAAAVVIAGRQLGDDHLGCDARLVARWKTEMWDVRGPPTSGPWKLSPVARSPNSASDSEMPSNCHRLASSHPKDCHSMSMRRAGCGQQ